MGGYSNAERHHRIIELAAVTVLELTLLVHHVIPHLGKRVRIMDDQPVPTASNHLHRLGALIHQP